jgi:hypothetical protein
VVIESLLTAAVVCSVANLVALMVITGKHSVHIEYLTRRLDKAGF